MPIILFILFVTLPLHPLSFIDVPSETYLTYDEYLQSKSSPPSIKAPSDWIQLTYRSPLIGKFQINDHLVLSISVFDGGIGDELSNLNRWRSQLGLEKQTSSDVGFKRYTLNGHLVRQVSLSNGQQFVSIYWITVADRHIFNKFVSSQSISSNLMDRFIESQSWAEI